MLTVNSYTDENKYATSFRDAATDKNVSRWHCVLRHDHFPLLFFFLSSIMARLTVEYSIVMGENLLIKYDILLNWDNTYSGKIFSESDTGIDNSFTAIYF